MIRRNFIAAHTAYAGSANKSWRISLRGKLLILFSVILLILLASGAAGIGLLVFRTEHMAWQERLISPTRVTAEQIGAFLDQQKQALDLVAMLGVRQVVNRPELLERTAEEHPALLEIVVVNSSGRVVAAAPAEASILAQCPDIPQAYWFLQALNGEPYSTDLQTEASGKPYIILARPILQGGVVAARLDTDFLSERLAGLQVGHSVQAYVVNERGEVIAHSRPDSELDRAMLADHPGVAERVTNPGLPWNRAFTGLTGENVFGSAVPIQEPGWTLVTEVAAAEVYAASRNGMIVLVVIVALFGTLLFWTTSIFLENLVLKPVRQIQTGALEIGQGNLSHRIEVANADEIGAVAEAFNQMAVDLTERELARRQAVAELQKAQQELERRVEQRTAELEQANRQLQTEIEQRQRTQAALKASEERYALATRGANDGLWDWDLQTDVLYYSPRWKAMLGYEEAEVGNAPWEWFQRIHPDDQSRVRTELSNHLNGVTPHFESEHRMRHRDGSYRWMLTRGLAVRDEAGRPTRVAGSQSDITERKLAEEQLVFDAFHDGLTYLPNRALFRERLGRAMERMRRHPETGFALLLLDIDRFKIINDSLGHTVGDMMLIAIAGRLSACLRSTDTAARLGGDEFAILLEDIRSLAEAQRATDRIQEIFQKPFKVGEHQVFTSASIGIVACTPETPPEEQGPEAQPPTYDRPSEILRDSEIAMYRAKSQGKARSEFFNPKMRQRALNLLEVESELHRALERGEFELYYQVIEALTTGQKVGFEALIRWRHPRRGLVPPGEFIPVAEESDLIVPLGEWVLREACRQARLWQARFPGEPPLTISVNISGKQFAYPRFIDQVESVLSETGLDATTLQLEITESVFMDNVEEIHRQLQRLRSLGVHLQIDDFGTGYSSLGYLHRFPIDTIKIDRSFISRIEQDNDREIIRTILKLAHGLGMETVAEGIETPEQLDLLKEMGCQYGQGYLLSRPVDAGSVESLLADKSQPEEQGNNRGH